MVLKVGRQEIEHDFFLRFTNRLNHKPLIVGQKEETSTFTRAFTRLKNLLSVRLRAEAFLKHLETELVCLEKFTKLVQLVVSDVRFRAYNGHVALISLFAIGSAINGVIRLGKTRLAFLFLF